MKSCQGVIVEDLEDLREGKKIAGLNSGGRFDEKPMK